MSNELLARGSLEIPTIFDKFKEGIPKFRTDLEGLIEFITPGLEEAFNFGAEIARDIYDLFQEKLIPIPDDLELDLEPILATFVIGYNEALGVFKIRTSSRKKTLLVNGVQKTTDIQLQQYKNEFDNKIKSYARQMFTDSFRQGFKKMQAFIGPVG